MYISIFLESHRKGKSHKCNILKSDEVAGSTVQATTTTVPQAYSYNQYQERMHHGKGVYVHALDDDLGRVA